MPRAFGETNPNKAYNNWLKAYMHHQRFSESPLNYHFWVGVSVVAGALRRKVWIDQRHFQWTPNMYIVLVGPAGVVAKSTTLRGGKSLLERVEGVKFGPQSTTWQALIEVFKNSVVMETFSTSSGSDLQIPMSCLTITVGELGTFLDPRNREQVDLLTDMWDGQAETWRRFTRLDKGTEIPNPWLNLVACTTPSWLKANFPEDLVGGGLTSRIVFVYGEKKRQLIPYPAMEIADQAYKAEDELLLSDLNHIAEIKGEYRLTPEAISWGSNWYRGFQNGKLPAHLASGRYDGYVARKQTHIHKLGMVLAAAKRDDLTIEKEDLQEAERLISELETDMKIVFDSIGVHESAVVTSEVEILIRNHKTIHHKALWKECIKTKDPIQFQNAIKALVEAGTVSQTKVGDGYVLTYIGDKRGE